MTRTDERFENALHAFADLSPDASHGPDPLPLVEVRVHRNRRRRRAGIVAAAAVGVSVVAGAAVVGGPMLDSVLGTSQGIGPAASGGSGGTGSTSSAADLRDGGVRAALQDFPFPAVTPLFQPSGGKTLVGLDTLFRVSVPTTRETVPIDGRQVSVEARPVRYVWHFGDGSPAFTTTKPGRPYPAKDIAHKYADAGRYTIRLDVVYGVRYRVEGGPWKALPGGVRDENAGSTSVQVVAASSVLR